VTSLTLFASLVIGIFALVLLAHGDRPVFRMATPVLFGALILWIWQLVCTGYGVPLVLLPAPSQIGAAIINHLATLSADFQQTFIRAVIPGWIIGCASGLLAAIALDASPFLRRGVLPLSSLVSAMPIVGIAPIMVMWFGFDWQSKAAVVVVMTFFPMLVNAAAGIAQTGAMEADLMRSYAAGYTRTLIKLRLPSALPFIFNALKLNATLALIGAIVAEFFGTPIVGMGFRISTEAARLNLDIVWAEIVMAAVAGSLSFALLALVERIVTFWHPSFR
jgi:NitT/TauT family transport system permease protein